MKRLGIVIPAAAFAAIAILGGCKTTEENYRQAYEKAVAARDSADAIDETIYGQVRRRISEQSVVTVAGDTIPVRVIRVRVASGEGGSAESLRPYNVVAAQFKQLFNARSMRKRLAGSGFATAFIVETAEPYYYVVASSHDTAAEASEAMTALIQADAVKMKAPCPFILDASADVR